MPVAAADADLIANLVTIGGVFITPQDIRQWAARGKVARLGVRDGRQQYDFRQVRDVAREQAA